MRGPHPFVAAAAHVFLAPLVDSCLGVALDVLQPVARALESLARPVSQALGRVAHPTARVLPVRGSQEQSDSGAEHGAEDDGRYTGGVLPVIVEVRIFLHGSIPPWPAVRTGTRATRKATLKREPCRTRRTPFLTSGASRYPRPPAWKSRPGACFKGAPGPASDGHRASSSDISNIEARRDRGPGTLLFLFPFSKQRLEMLPEGIHTLTQRYGEDETSVRPRSSNSTAMNNRTPVNPSTLKST